MSCDQDQSRPCSAEDDYPGAGERTAADDAYPLLPLRPEGCTVRFEDSSEWKWTKKTCTGLFRALGRYYDELWFPTVIAEWCELYYRCNNSRRCDYWRRRDAWLAGDEQVRMAVWYEVLEQRMRRDRQVRRGCGAANTDRERRTVDPVRIAEMRRTLDEANDRIVMRRMKGPELARHDEEQPTAEERARAETEAAEIALADPSDDPNWTEMRYRMRGAFTGLNLARRVVSGELLAHMMVELCDHWRQLPPIVDHQIEPLLERNIVREVRHFRFGLFGRPPVVVAHAPCEPEQDACSPGGGPGEPEACSPREPVRNGRRREPEKDACSPREPGRNARRREPEKDACRREPEPEECAGGSAPPAQRPCTARPKRPKTRPIGRGPGSNKLVEARAKLNAARMKAFEEKNK